MGDYHVRFCKRGKAGNSYIDSTLVVSRKSSIFQWFNCSLSKTVLELGLKRCKTVWILST